LLTDVIADAVNVADHSMVVAREPIAVGYRLADRAILMIAQHVPDRKILHGCSPNGGFCEGQMKA